MGLGGSQRVGEGSWEVDRGCGFRGGRSTGGRVDGADGSVIEDNVDEDEVEDEVGRSLACRVRIFFERVWFVGKYGCAFAVDVSETVACGQIREG